MQRKLVLQVIMKKVNCAIIGSGNIGMNLLYKIRKSKTLNCNLLIGRNPDSKNLIEAKEKGYFVSAESISALTKYEGMYEIIFDATTAENHRIIAPILDKMQKIVIDLTPSKIGKLCIPSLNAEECLSVNDVNMVTCGGQSTVPIAAAMKNVCLDIRYFEVVATIASASAGAGTRENIDEYIYTTSQALSEFTGVNHTKAMIVLNPADPPIVMRNTLYAIAKEYDIDLLKESVSKMEKIIRGYVPGFSVIVPPTAIKRDIITVTVQVEGSGDFLPRYAGNLDIITCAGIEMAELYAYNINEKGGTPF